MTYLVKEIFLTVQGEGAQTGRVAVFCRFTGCNLWTGREAHRAKAICQFCDTDFVGTDGSGGGKYRSAEDLAAAVSSHWPSSDRTGRFVVCTGGEPLLQLDQPAVDALHAIGFEIAIETNGTQPAPHGIDWICVSPKAGAPLLLTAGDELKLVYPQDRAQPSEFEELDFHRFSLSPMDGPDREHNTELALQYCLDHPKWQLNLQTHKFIGVR